MNEAVAVAYVDELRAGECKVVTASEQRFALYNVAGKFYATDNICPHKGGPLGDGCLDGRRVTCPWHDWKFDVVTGENADSPQTRVKLFETFLQGEKVWIRLS